MKKLMLILVVALCASLTQAAQVSWRINAGPAANRLLDYTGNAAFAGTAYLILTSDAATFTSQLAKDGTIGTTATYGSTTAFNQFGGMVSAAQSTDTLGAAADQSFSILLVQTVCDNTY